MIYNQRQTLARESKIHVIAIQKRLRNQRIYIQEEKRWANNKTEKFRNLSRVFSVYCR